MIIELKVKNRKELVKAISDFYKEKAVYLRVPTCEYKISNIFITKEGDLRTDEDFNFNPLKEYLEEIGIIEKQERKEPETKIEKSRDEKTKLVIDLTCETEVFKAFLETKEKLLKKALGLESIKIADKKITLYWNKNLDDVYLQVYKNLLEKIFETLQKQKRVNTSKTEIINERYYFRCYLLRLGYIGEEFKLDRRILLENLEGSAAFRIQK